MIMNSRVADALARDGHDVVSRQIWEIGKAHSFFPLSDCDGS
jgi:hypothetical protein